MVRAAGGRAFWSNPEDVAEGIYAGDGQLQPSVDAVGWSWVRTGPDQWQRQLLGADRRLRWDGLSRLRWGVVLAQTGGVEVVGFACRVCSRVSWNPADGEEGYCGACSDWTGLEG